MRLLNIAGLGVDPKGIFETDPKGIFEIDRKGTLEVPKGTVPFGIGGLVR